MKLPQNTDILRRMEQQSPETEGGRHPIILAYLATGDERRDMEERFRVLTEFCDRLGVEIEPEDVSFLPMDGASVELVRRSL